MFLRIVFVFVLVQIISAQQQVQQKGLGLNCKPENRGFWSTVKLNEDHTKRFKTALNGAIPAFDRRMFLNYNGDRTPVDTMMYDGFKYFFPLVLKQCIEDPVSNAYVTKIEQYINNLLDWPTWVEVEADKGAGFVSFNGTQHYVDLFACN
jgi:hypothetical protein